MLDGGTNCGKGGTTMAAVHGPGDHWWRHVWSGWTTCGADNLRRDSARMHTQYLHSCVFTHVHANVASMLVSYLPTS